jgi:uncharacterized membrane protein YkvA (DUF1232 family)
MFGRFKLFGQIWKTGRLALRLARDSRVPMTAKLVLGGTLLYLVSPIDVVPDWLPIAGQADDIAILLAGLNMFIKACPRRLVDEHSGKANRDEPLRYRWDEEPRSRTSRPDWEDEPRSRTSRPASDDEPRSSRRSAWDDEPVGAGSRRGDSSVIEGEYRRVR